MQLKLNVLLAKTDHLAGPFKALIADYIKFFKNNEGQFKGFLKTYTPKDGTIDDPSKRGSQNVVTTVQEKLDYLVTVNTEYIDALFSQEATNASGEACTNLYVDGIHFGKYSSLELLRLKSLLEHQDFSNLYATLPVREDTKNWVKTGRELYKDREIYEDEAVKGVSRTTEKESYILPDPNLVNIEGAKYTPVLAQKNTIIELGEYTSQNFTGAITSRERAAILGRRSKLLNAVVAAIKEANDCEVVPSEMTSSKLFGYLHTGNI